MENAQMIRSKWILRSNRARSLPNRDLNSSLTDNPRWKWDAYSLAKTSIGFSVNMRATDLNYAVSNRVE
ncbi:hypothetical protein ACE6H2_009339 [Prunus campanulata]